MARLVVALAGVALFAGLTALSPAVEEPAAKAEFLVLPYLQNPKPTGMTIMWETSTTLPARVEYGPTKDLGLVAEGNKQGKLHSVTLTDLKPGMTYHYQVKSGDLVSKVYSFRAPPAYGTKKWKMALYGDSRSYPKNHAKVAEQVRKADVDLIVHTGDIVVDGRNHDSWRKEFFEPLGDVARSVPFITAIGNHERDSANYWSYVTLPGNERFYGIDFASAHFVGLDSNTWVKQGRDSEQTRWLQTHLAEKRDARWTFAFFHHPPFSAHATRPVNPIRWDWAPIFLDPASKVDGVLNGHDHFYARNHRMGYVGQKPTPGVLFMTSAGGAAPLYKTKPRDYLARIKETHHFTLFEFDGDRVQLTAIDTEGKVFDTYTLSKDPTPPEEFASYEVEELRDFFRKAIIAQPPVVADPEKATEIDTTLKVPNRFKVNVKGTFTWDVPHGWHMEEPQTTFVFLPGEPFTIPIKATAATGKLDGSPKLTITFAPGQFCNRVIELYPLQLSNSPEVAAAAVEKAPVIDGKLDETVWSSPGMPLYGIPPQGGRRDRVWIAADKDFVYVAARLDDPAGAVKIKPPRDDDEAGKTVLQGEHLAVTFVTADDSHLFALTPDHLRYQDSEYGDEIKWQGKAARDGNTWCVEMAIPRSRFKDWREVRVNVIHRAKEGTAYRDLHLTPCYTQGPDPDKLPDPKFAETPARMAKLILK